MSLLRTPRKISSSVQSPLSASAESQSPALPTSTINNALNKTVNNSTGIYQQSVYLRSRLHRLPAFAHFVDFSHSGPRASKDVVSQLWIMLSLGKPLCVLFNLQDVPEHVKIAEFVEGEVDPEPLRKERQRAVALFIMGVNALKSMGLWDKDAPIFSIGELVGDAMDTNGFVKVLATVLYLLDKLPSTVWSDKVHPMSHSALPSHESLSSMTSREDMERANIVRELIETERKYCQDLETMQSYAESLRQSGIEDADTIHRLFPALGKLTNFQRKLLIGMESTAEHALDEQDWGLCFIQHEAEFAIYDAYIANYSQALDLAVAEQATLMAASDIINPLQLPAFLIKPVQRLCRYPMLLSSLLKLTPPDRPLHASLSEGVAAVKRIADMANRALREKENEETLQNLLSRVKDWKGIQLDSTGPLLLDEVFGVTGERRSYTEYHIFLFNRMLLLCRPKELQTEIDTPEKEKGDWLTHGFKKSLSSSALSVTVAPPTPKNAGPSAFLSGGAMASRRAKTQFSIRGVLYIRNIADITPETSSPYALHIKYQDRGDVHNWTLQCRNDEQVTLWNNEIQRLLKLWSIEEADIRRNANLDLKEQMAMYSSHESLDITSLVTLRSARRPVHPYESTFGTAPNKARTRNGSLNLAGDKPDVNNGRSRSSSVSSMASDVYGPSADAPNSVSFPKRPSSSRQNSIHPYRSEDPFVVSTVDESRHTRTVSQNSGASIEAQHPFAIPHTRTSLASRIRNGPLPPQPPPPTGPAPPRPDEAPYMFPFERRTHSRQSSAGSEASFRALPVPPSLSLRERVGDRMPAPLAPVNLTPVTPSGQTPQSTLPELPSKEPKRPMSQRKTTTPVRGPRERTAPTPTSGYLDAPPEIRSRNVSNSSLTPAVADAPDLSTSTHSNSNRKLLPRRPRRSSESSSTTDSVSFVTSSDQEAVEISPITPNSFGEETKKSSSKVSFQPTHKRTGSGPTSATSARLPVRVESLILSPRLEASRRQAEIIGGLTPKTPKTAFHETRDRNAILSGGLSRPKTPSDSHPHARTPTVPSHSRNNSASGVGRTPAIPDMAMVTVRLHHEGSKFLIKLGYTASRRDFIDKVRRKIRLCSTAPLPAPETLPPSHFASEEHVSYLNENNQFAKLETDYDFSLAWNSVNCKRTDPKDEGILILAVGNTDHLVY